MATVVVKERRPVDSINIFNAFFHEGAEAGTAIRGSRGTAGRLLVFDQPQPATTHPATFSLMLVDAERMRFFRYISSTGRVPAAQLEVIKKQIESVLHSLRALPLIKFFISRSSESIIFRMETSAHRAVRKIDLEVFTDYDANDPEDIQAIMRVSVNNQKRKPLYGSRNYLLEKLSQLHNLPTSNALSFEAYTRIDVETYPF